MLRGGLVAALAALVTACAAAATATAAPPVKMTASFERGATLGAPSALDMRLQVDVRRVRSPVNELRLLYPESLGVVSSGLGVAACRRPPSDFVEVLVSGIGLGGCPPNAVMAYGTAVADIRLSDGQVIPEYATLSLLSGPIDEGVLGLVLYVDGQRPFGGRLVIGGRALDAPRPFGGGLGFSLPAVPRLEGLAEVFMRDMRLTIGAPRIVYYERVRGARVAYRPERIVLPNRCPRGGFPFRAHFGFEDGTHAVASTTAPCPPSAPRRR